MTVVVVAAVKPILNDWFCKFHPYFRKAPIHTQANRFPVEICQAYITCG